MQVVFFKTFAIQKKLTDKIEYFEQVVDASKYLEEFRDAKRFIKACKQCKQYSRNWSCPPYDIDIESILSKYRKAKIICAKITPINTTASINNALEHYKPVKQNLRQLLKEEEERLSGLAMGFAGACDICNEAVVVEFTVSPVVILNKYVLHLKHGDLIW